MVIKPRPEARPLVDEELTQEQRSAGQKATELLRAMAHDGDRPLTSPPKEHSYAPAIDEFRSNRVILLDGARGSGKSALLVTLLNAYVKTLTGASVPKGFKKWIRSDDRIVPVGLIDLQPLPESSHLMLYLIANLERVVEAMEPRQEPRPAFGAPWHAVQRDELESRTLWRKFARVASMGWDGNLSARKSHLDPEAFAAEQQDEELLRLDVVTVFRLFVDALVRDYRKWRGWEGGTSPLFLLAIDDADMNPTLSSPLLQLLRTLWHPRLAFLLTGDSRMFVSVVQDFGKPEAAVQQLLRFLPDSKAYVDENARQQRELRADIYSKIIPRSHRCELRPLTSEERLRVGPKLESTLFRTLRVPVAEGTLELTETTLAKLFDANPQTREALPDRLRHLYELEAFVRPADKEEEETRLKLASAAAKALERLWLWVTERWPVTAEQWRSLVQIDEAGVLQVSHALALNPLVVVTHQLDVSVRWSLSLGYPVRFDLSAQNKPADQDAAKAMAAVLILATDYAAVARDARIERQGHALSGLGTPLYAHTRWERSPGSIEAIFPWPTPDWDSFADFVQLRNEWELVVRLMLSSEGDRAERAARGFLRAVLNVGLGAVGEPIQSTQADAYEWSVLARDLARVARLARRGRRQAVLVEWSLGRAGLLAAPESGLPAEAANRFLDELRDAMGPDWEQAQKLLLEARQERVELRISDRGMLHPDSKDVLKEVDMQFEEHRFTRVIEDYSDEYVSAAVKAFSDRLSKIQPQWLGERVPHHRRGVDLYLTALRRDMLRQSPTRTLRVMREAMSHPDKVSGMEEKLIERMWVAGVEATGESRLTNVVQSRGARVVVRQDYVKLARERTSAELKKQERVFELRGDRDLKVGVWTVEGSAESILHLEKHDGSEGALEAAFRIAFDYQEDYRGANTYENRRESVVKWWAGVEVELELEQPYRIQPWPLPEWQTLREKEELEFNWGEVLSNLSDALRPEDWSDERLCDALAYWFVDCCERLSNWWEAESRVDLNVGPSNLGSFFGKDDKIKHPQRERILAEWKNRLVILATPESGLSANAANAILRGHFMKPSNRLANWDSSWKEYQAYVKQRGPVVVPSDPNVMLSAQQEHMLTVQRKWEMIYGLRRARLLQAGVDASEVDDFMLVIDNSHDSHPWVEWFVDWRDVIPQNREPSGAA